MLDTKVDPNLQPTSASIRGLLKGIAERRCVEVNDLTLDAVRGEETLQVVLLDHAAGTIHRLNQGDEQALFAQVGGLLDGTVRAATINASHTRLGRSVPE